MKEEAEGKYGMRRLGQNRIYILYMTVYLAISLLTIPYIHLVIHMVLANSGYVLLRLYMVLAVIWEKRCAICKAPLLGSLLLNLSCFNFQHWRHVGRCVHQARCWTSWDQSLKSVVAWLQVIMFVFVGVCVCVHVCYSEDCASYPSYDGESMAGKPCILQVLRASVLYSHVGSAIMCTLYNPFICRFSCQHHRSMDPPNCTYAPHSVIFPHTRALNRQTLQAQGLCMPTPHWFASFWLLLHT